VIIANDFEVAEPVDKVWRFFDNIPQVASCLPGAELTKDLGDDKYEGRVAIRMGPVRMQFAGTAAITERDEAAKHIVVHAAGADEKGRGQAAMVVGATLSAKGRSTKVAVSQDLQLSGAAAQYGRGMISDFSAILMRDFAVNMQDRIERLERGESAGYVVQNVRNRGIEYRRLFQPVFNRADAFKQVAQRSHDGFAERRGLLKRQFKASGSFFEGGEIHRGRGKRQSGIKRP